MNTISEADSRAMVRLLAETASVSGGHHEMKHFLMSGLCSLIDADAWVWTLGIRTAPGEPQSYGGFLHGGFSEDRFAKLLIAVEHPVMGEAVTPFYSALQSLRPVTMLREEIDPKGLALSEGVRDRWKEADIGPLIMSGHPLDEMSLSCLALYRPVGHKPFGEREKRIAHIILTEVPWLHAIGWPEDRGAKVPGLPPRQRIILNLLLDGLDRKYIAASLGVSENTVAAYARDVYRHFGVNSQPQLMRKFLSANPHESSP